MTIEQPLSYNELRSFIDDEGREIFEVRPVTGNKPATYLTNIVLIHPMFGEQTFRITIPKAKNVAEAFQLHDAVIKEIQDKSEEQKKKPKLVMANDVPSFDPQKLIV
jgi:hypothetical protein